METKELRIGNLLQDKISRTFLRVIELSEKYIGTYVIDRTKFPLPSGWSAEFIPLNESFLKDRFAKIERKDSYFNYYQITKNNDASKCLSIKTDGNYFSVFNNSECNKEDFQFIRQVNYLHELQNIVFIITGEEMTIKL